MDIKFLDTKSAAERGLTFTVKQPESGEETDVKISVVGAGSRVHKEALREYQRAADVVKKEYEGKEDSIEAEDAYNLVLARFVAKCTKGWSGLTSEGEQLPFSEEAAINLYLCSPDTLSQVIAQIGNLQEMLGKPKASLKSSAK